MTQFLVFLGVDGGQSSTTALIGDETGRVLGSGSGGPCNHVGAAEGREKFVRAIEECVSTACRAAGLDPAEVHFASACLGFSGGPEDKQPILTEILRTERLLVTTDALIALVGATAGQPGIITIAGTGSIAFGRNAQGRTARVGGWGYTFGDEGGAFDLTRQALRAALSAEEGWGTPTALHALLLEATGAASANDLLHRFYTTEFPRPRIASFSKLVDQAARQGDAVAQGILRKAAHELAALAAAVRRQLFQRGEAARVAYIGGVFRSRLLREDFCALVEMEPGNACGPPAHGPAAGALLEAYYAAGLSPKLSNLPEFKT
jgi:N-acetylglucosamine kinase-like BadF-type ATPase